MTTSKDNNDKRLTLTGHLEELRKRIIVSAIILIALTAICFSFAESIIRSMVNLGSDIEFIFISPTELMMANIKIALFGGLIIAAPFLIIQIWLFVSPGLSYKEKRIIAIAIIMGSVFFVLGAIFAYFAVLPVMIAFFMGFQLDVIQPMISFSSFLDFITSTILAFGIIFELPILMILLTRFGIVKVGFLKKNRKYMILAIFVAAAIITPPDIVSQILLALPMIALMEIGIFLSGLLAKKQ